MIHNLSLFLVLFSIFFVEIEFSFSFYLQVNIKFLVKFARQSLLLASGKVMCFSKYTGTGIKNHLPKLGSKRWKLPLCDCVRTLDLSQFLFYLRGHHCLLGLSGFV